MSDDIDWNRPAVLHERSDDGSEMYFDFEKIDEGTLGAMVARVAAMEPLDRSRVILDVLGQGNLSVAEIMALAARADLPAA